MSTEESRPALGAGAASENLGRVQTSTIPEVWPNHLATAELQQLVHTLDTALRAANDLPPDATYEELRDAAARARVALRRRLARQQVTEARRALSESGWSA